MGDNKMYFDPGFGSMIIQAVVAAIATLGVVWGVMKTRVKNLGKKKADSNQADPKADNDEQL